MARSAKRMKQELGGARGTPPVDGPDAAKGAAATGPRPQRVFEKIYEDIRDDVAGGKLQPGDKLPPEREFAERLGISRSAVREALRALEASGILHLQKGVSGGAYIRKGEDRGAVHRSLHDIVVLGQIPLADVTSVRGMLMSRAVELACRNGTPAQFEQIEQNIETTMLAAREEDEAALLHCHAEFFKTIGECSGNEYLALLIEASTAIALQLVAVLHVQMTQELILLRQEILASLKARDQIGAVRTMSEMLAFQHGYVTGQAQVDRTAARDAAAKSQWSGRLHPSRRAGS